jgi:perosamine synthetase
MIDAEPRTWNINPCLIEEKITPRTRGIIVVHLYGHPVDMDPVIEIARRHGLFVLEDAAEAHGAIYKGQVAGSIGDIATFSFFGNKVLSTGEGGMVVTNDPELASKIRLLKDQGMDPNRRYWYPVIGYNYRMTNVAAAIGLAQVEKADWHIQQRRELAGWYRQGLAGVPGLIMQVEEDWARHVYQFFTVVLDEGLPIEREEVIAYLGRHGIEGRPVVYPMHTLPAYSGSVNGQPFPVSESIAFRGINLPTFAGLTRADVNYVCQIIKDCLVSPLSASSRAEDQVVTAR